MELKQAGSFLFSPEYYLCYLIMAVVWVISICWKLNRSACQGILGAALVVFSLCMTFLACHLSIAPNDQDLLFTILFYTSILGGVGTGYYLISRSYKDSILLPFCLFLFAVMGVWSYMVSGLATNVSKTLQVLVANVPVESTASANAAARLEESLHLEDQRKVFYKFDRSNEFSLISNEEAAKRLEPRIEKAAPNTFDETTLPLFARLLAMYYQGGKQKMKLGTWEYAMTFPIHNFNQNAKNNNAYFFLIILLYVFGLVSCSGRIFFGEDL